MDFENDSEISLESCDEINEIKTSNQSSISNDEKVSIFNFISSNSDPSSPLKSPRPAKFLEENKENQKSNFHLTDDEEFVNNELKHLTSTPAGVKIKSNVHLRSKVKAEFPEGRFFGFGRHRDGAEISEYKVC